MADPARTRSAGGSAPAGARGVTVRCDFLVLRRRHLFGRKVMLFRPKSTSPISSPNTSFWRPPVSRNVAISS